MKVAELPQIGTPLAGGFYAGRFQNAAAHFALIVSPAAGDIEGTWGEPGKMLDGCRNFVDGKQNTIDLAEAGSELARLLMQLDINGFTDWFLPARDQLELLYRNLKPTTEETWGSYMDGHNTHSVPPGDLYTNGKPVQTDIVAFQEDGDHALHDTWYWTSTQYSAHNAFCQDFGDGYQYGLGKSNELRARAVRQIQLVIE